MGKPLFLQPCQAGQGSGQRWFVRRQFLHGVLHIVQVVKGMHPVAVVFQFSEGLWASEHQDGHQRHPRAVQSQDLRHPVFVACHP